MPTDPVKAKTRALHATLKRRAGNEPCMSLEDIRMEFSFFMRSGDNLCRYCRTRVSHANVSLDHIIPVARGGGHTKSNLAFICTSCNKSKGSMSGDEFKSLLKALDEWSIAVRNPALRDYVLTQMRTANSFRLGANRRERR